jgi:hypothetical protein
MGNISILAEFAAEIAPHCSYGISQAAGIKMKQGFFFNRIHMPCYYPVIYQRNQSSTLIFPDIADTPARFADCAAVMT